MRNSGLLLLAAFLFWLPFEDTEVYVPLGLAIWVGLWALESLHYLRREKGQDLQVIRDGLMVGILIPVTAAGFMVFKTGVHAHGFSEYSARQFIFVFSILPFSLVGGLVLSFLLQRRS